MAVSILCSRSLHSFLFHVGSKSSDRLTNMCFVPKEVFGSYQRCHSPSHCHFCPWIVWYYTTCDASKNGSGVTARTVRVNKHEPVSLVHLMLTESMINSDCSGYLQYICTFNQFDSRNCLMRGSHAFKLFSSAPQSSPFIRAHT